MKHSGIEWIGDIPKEWKVSRLKDIGCLYGGLTGKSGDDFNVEDEDSFAFFIPFTNIFNNDVIDNTKLSKVKVNDGESQNSVLDGDLLFLMSSEDYDGVGKNSLMKGNVPNLYLNSFCKGFRVKDKNVYSSFLNFLMSSQVIRELVRMEAKGFIRINLRQDRLACCPILLPPLSEQQKIADYLDKVCGEIDGLVALQEAMIDELKAYKQSVITEAVTRGLNPNVPLKPSGIDWIGDIPEHWDLSMLKRLLTFQNGQDYKHVENDCGYPVYGSGGIFRFATGYLYDGESILFGRKGTIDKPLYVEGKFWTVDTMYYTIPLSGNNCKFLFYEATLLPFGKYQTSTALPSMTQTILGGMMVVVPPLSEQQQIASFLDEKCAEIDALVTIKQQKIEELKEYKKSIIYEYVTGKKEVV